MTTRKTHPLRYASGLFALTLLTQVFHGFSYAYYVDQQSMITMHLANIAKIIFVVVDGSNDILFAALSEKTKSKYGKRLPWLVLAMPWLMITILLTFAVNKSIGFSTMQFFVYYLLISIAFENFSTIMYLNYGSLFPVLFTEPKERAKVSSFRHCGEMIGMAICLVLTPLLLEYIGYLGVILIFGSVYLIVMSYCVTGIRYDKELETKNIRQKYSFRKTVKDVFCSKSFIIYNVAVSFNQACLGVLLTIYPLYAKYVLKVNSLQQGIIMAVLFIGVLSSIKVWYDAINKYGHRKCWRFSLIVFPIALASLAIPFDFISGLIVILIVSPFVGGILITPDLMNSEIIDIDKKKHGMSREASFMSLGTLMQKVSVAISAIAMSIVSMIFGYENGDNVGSNPELTFRVVTGVMMPIIALCSLAFGIWYLKNSKKEYQQIIDSTTHL